MKGSLRRKCANKKRKQKLRFRIRRVFGFTSQPLRVVRMTWNNRLDACPSSPIRVCQNITRIPFLKLVSNFLLSLRFFPLKVAHSMESRWMQRKGESNYVTRVSRFVESTNAYKNHKTQILTTTFCRLWPNPLISCLIKTETKI